MELEEIIDMMIDEKISCKDYKEMSEEEENMEYKEMFEKISDDEKNHYKMLREYVSQVYKKD